MVLVEYCVVLVTYCLAYNALVVLANAFQCFFVLAALFVEVGCYAALGHPFKGKCAKCNIPKSIFLLISLAPNYIHVISSSLVAGGSYDLWRKVAHVAADFANNWSIVPWIGKAVGELGIPIILSWTLFASMAMHVSAAVFFLTLTFGGRATLIEEEEFAAEVCDSANLQFLGQAIKFHDVIHIDRAWIWNNIWCQQEVEVGDDVTMLENSANGSHRQGETYTVIERQGQRVVIEREGKTHKFKMSSALIHQTNVTKKTRDQCSGHFNPHFNSHFNPHVKWIFILLNVAKFASRLKCRARKKTRLKVFWKNVKAFSSIGALGQYDVPLPALGSALVDYRQIRNGPCRLRTFVGAQTYHLTFEGNEGGDVFQKHLLFEKRQDSAETREVMGFQLARLGFACTVKMLFLWLKTSLTAVLWAYSDWWLKANMTVALVLCWYGLVQQLPTFFGMFTLARKRPLSVSYAFIRMAAPCLFCGLGVIGLHTIGIARCASHDFSLLRLGCTAK